MRLDVNLEAMFQAQMNRELYNSLCYQDLAGQMEAVTWDGFAKWLRKSGQEELEHYKKFNDFLVDRNAIPRINGIGMPNSAVSNPYSAILAAQEIEFANTESIKELELACSATIDSDARNFLIWALEEQRNAEREIQDILTELQRASGDTAALLLLDREMGAK